MGPKIMRSIFSKKQYLKKKVLIFGLIWYLILTQDARHRERVRERERERVEFG
jgi:hypothetical protein